MLRSAASAIASLRSCQNESRVSRPLSGSNMPSVSSDLEHSLKPRVECAHAHERYHARHQSHRVGRYLIDVR